MPLLWSRLKTNKDVNKAGFEIKMDVEKDFRDLSHVTKQYLLNDDQYQRKFTFQTVFYKSPYGDLYCCCPCGFDHEFLHYISDDGEIINEIFEQVLQNILRGKCPHVDNVPSEFVTETVITGAHLAAAVGSRDVFRECRGLNREDKTSIFKLTLFMVCLTTKNFNGLPRYYDMYLNRFERLPFHNITTLLTARKTDNRTCANAVKVEAASVLSICLKHGSSIRLKDEIIRPTLLSLIDIVKCLGSDEKSKIPREFRSFLLWFADGETIRENCFSAFGKQAVSETALVTGNLKIVKRLLKLIGTDCIHHGGVNLGQAAIIYDQPDSLNAFCKIMNRDELKSDKYNLGEICSVLQRRKCQRVLLKHRIQTPKPENMPLVNKAEILFRVLDTMYKCDKQEIETLLKGLMEINSCNRRIIQSYVQNTCTPDIRIIQMLLKVDAKIDCVNTDENSVLLVLLRRMREVNIKGARAMVELLLYENFDGNSNKAIVVEGLEIDVLEEILQYRGYCFRSTDYAHLAGEYITDTKWHCSFESNVLHLEDLDLESYGPLFIECGFPYTRDTVLRYLDKQLLPREQEYLQQCINETRSLMQCFRDSLRRHFKRKIHRFVESSGLPESLKDFVLLKRELTNLI